MSTEKHKGERIAKRMARAGLCSRRDAEVWISQGRVRVNGAVISSAALNVTESDKIVVNGKALPQTEQTRLFLYHKPAGLVTTHKDEQGRETVFSVLPPSLPRVVSVGRLDLNTEGLLLLTNDGELARYLELPSTAWTRKYRVRVHGRVDPKKLERLRDGIKVDGVHYKSIEATMDDTPSDRESALGSNSWLSVTLREGKNREIRKVMDALDLKVTRLIRTDYGPFSLGKMDRGMIVEVKPKVLQNQILKYFESKGTVLKEVPFEEAKRGTSQDGKKRSSGSDRKPESRKPFSGKKTPTRNKRK